MRLRKTSIFYKVLNIERNFKKALEQPGNSEQKLHEEHCYTCTGLLNSGLLNQSVTYQFLHLIVTNFPCCLFY